MPLLTWNDALALSVEVIDEQHKQMVDLLNQAYGAITTGSSPETVGVILAGLIDHTISHFATEEQVMEGAAYPGLAIHKGEHELLTSRVLGLERAFLAGQVQPTIDTLLFLKGWLLDHIEGHDMLLGAYLHGRPS